MNAGAWIALAGLGVVVLAHMGGFLWWAATFSASTKARLDAVEAKAKEHGDLRDIVIEMRTEMRAFRDSIKELAEGLKEARRPTRRSPAE